MKIQQISIDNIRSINNLTWDLSGSGNGSWNVVLGDNGSGKSTLLRSIALGLMGPKDSLPARQNWNTWLGSGGANGSIQISLRPSSLDKYSTQGTRSRVEQEVFSLDLRTEESRVNLVKGRFEGTDPDRHIWGSGAGWFSCGLGPFRRFEGGDPNANRLFYTNPKLAAHITLFGEEVALTECLPWLKDLYLQQLERKSTDPLLPKILGFINQADFLPFDYKLKEVTSEGVVFTDGNQQQIPVADLSDGFRSFLSLIFELIRQIKRSLPSEALFDANAIVTEGVVMIDEIDAHLHPNWQKSIGLTLRKLFPKIQFIVTTHSPLICHAVQEAGAILRMPSAGSGDQPLTLSGADRNRLVYGDIIDGLASGGFEAGETRSDIANDMLDELAKLNVKQLSSDLSPNEISRQAELRSTFPSNAHDITPEIR